MAKYILNKNSQSNGDHEMHNETSGCSHMPNPENRTTVGYYDNCHDALRAAKQIDSDADGCYYCCEPCHSS